MLKWLLNIKAKPMKNRLSSQLRQDEGRVKKNGRHVVYKDHLGYSTIGYGRLVDSRRGGGLTDAEAEYLLSNDIDEVMSELARRTSWFGPLDTVRKATIINMAFQLGVDGLLDFKNTIGYINAGDYEAASVEMLDSDWAREDTPERAERISKQFRTGEWQY